MGKLHAGIVVVVGKKPLRVKFVVVLVIALDAMEQGFILLEIATIVEVPDNEGTPHATDVAEQESINSHANDVLVQAGVIDVREQEILRLVVEHVKERGFGIAGHVIKEAR